LYERQYGSREILDARWDKKGGQISRSHREPANKTTCIQHPVAGIVAQSSMAELNVKVLKDELVNGNINEEVDRRWM
jgi:hypothetical protein